MFRWALVSNTTISPLVQKLKQEMKTRTYNCEFFLKEHGDSGQQIFTPNSELYAFQPDLVVLYLDLQQIKPMFELLAPFESQEKRTSLVSEVVEHVVGMVKAIRGNSSSAILVNGFSVLPRTALGIGLDQVYRNSVRQINLQVNQVLSNLQQCYIFDCESLWAEVGYGEYDRRFDDMAQFPFGLKMQRVLINEWLRYFRALQGLNRKCIVLDLDNTLWDGILGEDGLNGIKMGDTPEGRPFRRFQQALKALSRRGILLAINSKNNMADVKALFAQQSDMVLVESDFAAMQINWDDKATNIKRIAQELNIGVQHMVFLDDNPTERAWVREQQPEVLVPDLPLEKARYVDVLSECEVDALVVTEEDRKRSQMYWEDRQRRAYQSEAPSYEEFLKHLNLEVEIEPLSPGLLERATQLCQRTNQFNLTTRRHSAEQIKKFSESDGSKVLLLKSRDRFGDYGWSGLAIVTREDQSAVIDTFLLSCRVIGKNVEYALFEAVTKWARLAGCTHLQGAFIPSKKNQPCKSFLAQSGMTLAVGKDPAEAEEVYEVELLAARPQALSHIKLNINF